MSLPQFLNIIYNEELTYLNIFPLGSASSIGECIGSILDTLRPYPLVVNQVDSE